MSEKISLVSVVCCFTYLFKRQSPVFTFVKHFCNCWILLFLVVKLNNFFFEIFLAFLFYKSPSFFFIWQISSPVSVFAFVDCVLVFLQILLFLFHFNAFLQRFRVNHTIANGILQYFHIRKFQIYHLLTD